jgi:carboxypeptidase Taq
MLEIQDLNAALALQGWDQETGMPSAALAARARARGTLSGLIHDRLVDPELGAILQELSGAELNAGAAVDVRESLRDHLRAVRLPRELVIELTEATSLATSAWAEARAENDWPRFAPHLNRLVALRRREAEALGYEDEPYDALLDEYEPGAKAAELAALFAEVRAGLVPLIEAVRRRDPDRAPTLWLGEFPVAAQDALCRRVLRGLGFDFAAGRLDTSNHPFTSRIDAGDVRLTTAYHVDDLRQALYSTIHEGGHGLYEAGLPADAVGLPRGEAVSLGIHESQSRLWENQVGRSRAFMSHLLPLLREHFDGFADATAEALYRDANVVKPSLIRIEADEVTYNLHIILRMDLERALVRGELAVDDLPRAWNERMTSDLGVTPADDAEGVLQDIHWSFGLFGYFPTYALGNLYGAQLFAAVRREIPDLDDQIARGDFAPLLGWLRRTVHVHGRALSPRELVLAATGEAPSADAFLDGLRAKYTPLYDLETGDLRA